ncbi:MAG: secondary thiamine-phosphate synthase enzyme YjbQ [Pseudomonadota bacterium]
MTFTGEIPVNTARELDVIDLTELVQRLVDESRLKDGTAHLFVAGSTAALTTIEYEPGAIADLIDTFCRLAPRDMDYAHNARWGDGNGHSHVRAAILGPDLTVPVRDGRVFLGTWQQIILVEFDTRSRNRTVQLTAVGAV